MTDKERLAANMRAAGWLDAQGNLDREAMERACELSRPLIKAVFDQRINEWRKAVWND